MDPEILVLDEPTTFLDPPAQRGLVSLLTGLPQAKIVVTHDLRFAGALCSRAAFFDAGKIVAEGTVADMTHRFKWD
jgi:cobalt/nickel transport system ATP-binding protein